MLKHEVLKILESDARTTPEVISRMTGASLDEIKQIIGEAETDRTIVRYKTVINWEKVSNERVEAIIEVKVTPQRDTGFDAIARRVYNFPEARTVYLMSGTYDLAVLVTGKTMHQVADFVSQKLSQIDGVQGTTTHFMLKRYKEDGEVLAGTEQIDRQQVVL
ncbi:Lrp/AsnC family transcriptional regulator [Dehalogenimonas etheniformans]|uniref:Lrp/AsnC family transcriptional regulator n=1 Tax=Dehalogenimonas etheniformans TaxID=1536648 RepID=A0A2P5P9Z1_9CHLR|nr:Lrp/AsnC family transcriptional regulator [Dehalogenimonas etheniformans]PPD59123.1 Lrp/AsnC family transcriptional regulator [Dehalogenimonas etheniformans]QNT75833.1 Lrp/AsnC family transcriptional regulator [Dehalogenimonas etheniformans]